MSFLGKRILEAARANSVAVCGFDAFNMESAQAVVNAAEACRQPVFLQVGTESAAYMKMPTACRTLLDAKRQATVDICVHLDHGREPSSVEQLQQAAELGFESVMVDGSALSLEENVVLSRRVVEMAHPRGICVEAELGRVSRNLGATRTELDRLMTDPEEAARFVEATGIDYLAVSVGSVSGFLNQRAEIRLDLDRLARIAQRVACPLVFHGGTGIPTDQMREAAKLGVAKINIAHGFRLAFLDGVKHHLRTNPDEFDPRRALGCGREWAERFAAAKIREIGFGACSER